MNSTKVRLKVISKKESPSYNPEQPIRTDIELHVGYDQKNIYFQQSGGTNMILSTINQGAADMFKLGGDFDMVISPAEGD